MKHPFTYIYLFWDKPICKYLQSTFSLVLWDVIQTKKHKNILCLCCKTTKFSVSTRVFYSPEKRKKSHLIILILGIRYKFVQYHDYQILQILSWFKWNVKQSLNVMPYLNIIFMVICLFGYLDICLHQCSIMHFFYIHPALFLYFCISCQKNMTESTMK